MKRFFCGMAVALVLAGVMGVAGAETIESPSQISEVTVYADRVQVTRRAQLSLQPGAHSVVLAGLPGSIEEESVAAKGKGEAQVKLFGAKLVTTQLNRPQSQKMTELLDEFKKLNDARQVIVDAQEVQRKKLAFLESIKAASGEQIGKDLVTKQPSVNDVVAITQYLEQEMMLVFEKLRAAAAGARKIEEEINRVQREMERLKGESPSQQTAIVVDLEATRSGKFDLEVSYRLPGATWAPVYEARAAVDSAEVQLVSYGMIRQQTGENWENVTVHLSTAKPSLGGRMPEIEPWFLRKYEPPVAYPQGREMKRATLAYKPEASQEADEMSLESPAAAPLVEAELAVASIESRGPAMLFTLPKKETIPSDWQPHKAVMGNFALPAAMAYEATPKLSSYAYLRAKVKNNSEALLLAGAVQIFLDGAFVGHSSIDVIAPSEEFDLYLGVDERIRVERRRLKDKTDVSVLPGLHGKTKTIDYSYLTTVENFGAKPVKLTLIDQIPVSQHDEIKLNPVEFNPKPTEEDKEKPGVRRWNLTIPASGKSEVKVSYRLTHPTDFVVEGL